MPHRKNILITGANGLIGRELRHELMKCGHAVRTLSRCHGDYKWELDSGYLDSHALEGIECVVHLAGESVAQRWTAEARRQILHSRVKSTQMLTEAIQRQPHPIDLVCASGINYYGTDNPHPVTENSAPGSGFLADVCKEWEWAALQNAYTAAPACADEESNPRNPPACRPGEPAAGTRTHHKPRITIIRTGVVLSPGGGALQKMLPAFRAGIGGRIGSGCQMTSWISLDDIVRVYIRVIEDESLCGAVNGVSPNPVTNSEFTKSLGDALHRPTLLPVPAFLAALLFGEMGRETILSNLRVVPEKLLRSGFEWKHPDIKSALTSLIGRV